jgi:hypothetical protein
MVSMGLVTLRRNWGFITPNAKRPVRRNAPLPYGWGAMVMSKGDLKTMATFLSVRFMNPQPPRGESAMEDNSNPAMIVAFMVCAASGGLMGLLAGYVIWG